MTTAARSPNLVGSSAAALFVLQGLPGVGPALPRRLFAHLGSAEGVVTAGLAALTQVRGLGPTKAARIRELVALAISYV